MARILLAEDEVLIRLILAEELSANGHEVVEAGSGDEALRLAGLEPACDILVTDIHMPGKLDGIGLAARLREMSPRLPVLYVTGVPEALAAIGKMGPRDAFVRKPFAAPKVLELVDQLLAAVQAPLG